FWAGNDGGLWRRPAAWHERGRWTNLNPTLYTLQNYSVAVGTVGSGLAYWGGLQDNGESYTRTDMSRIEQAFTGDGGDTIVDPNDGNKAVEEYVYLDMYLTTDGATNILREISPSCLTATDPPAECDPSPRFIAPIEQDVNNPDHWVAGGRYVWDDTKAWDTVCDSAACDWKQTYDTGDGHSITALAANGAVTYTGWCGPCNPGETAPFTRGLATNYGGTWHQLSAPELPNRYITSIAVDPSNAAHAYVSFGSYSRRWIPDAGVGHVFETTNGGATWTDVTGNLPDAPVYKVILHGSDLIVGTEVGTFITPRHSSRPASWRNLGTGLPRVTVWDLTVAPDGRVAAGTHGRGTWEINLRR
ncbi:MAG TPA: glycosyl hydrolase, partial [Actinoplanes sp.]